ncbi:threonine ammonia-lyase [Alicyclobacillaceae bacterium I2511]|nr:threonine ammonia-lyase [Alicyclobacillaceae bacterium I2511]
MGFRKKVDSLVHTAIPDKPTLQDVQQAQQILKSVVKRTPLDASKTFSLLSHQEVYLKLENLQTTGSFKIRGAYYKISNLPDQELQHGVIAASAGNHAQGVALAAQLRQTPCTIVMPENASLAKIAATQAYGAKVVLQGNSYDESYEHARMLQHKFGYTFVHAFDDPDVIAGQGTVGLEILEQLPTVNAVVVPIGGGGLAAGVAIAIKSLRPDVLVFGVQAAAIPAFAQAFQTGQLTSLPAAATIADGIAVRMPGQLTFQLVKSYLDGIITVEEEEIYRTLVLLLERSKLVVEGAAGAALAACIAQKIPPNLGQVAVVLSGGNIDITLLSRLIEHGLVESGRYLRLAVQLADRPGALRDLLDGIVPLGANVLSITHRRIGAKILLGQTEVEIDLETRDAHHIQQILKVLQEKHYKPSLRD